MDESEKNNKKIKLRCKICNKKLGIMNFDCKCGHNFCGKHRYVYEHNCTYDYKNEHKKKLEEENPLIKHDKMGGERI